MTNSSSRVASSLILLLICWLGIDLSHVRAASDDKPVVMDKVESELVKPDSVGPRRSGGPSGGRDNKWVLVEFTYNVLGDPNAKEKINFMDEVTFKVSIEGRVGEGSAQQTAILQGEVTYMSVPLGKGWGSFYLSPDVAAQYHVDKNLSQYNINVQAVVGGQTVDQKDKKRDDENWYARSDYKMISGCVFTKNQTPFVLSDLDRYPTIKPKQ